MEKDGDHFLGVEVKSAHELGLVIYRGAAFDSGVGQFCSLNQQQVNGQYGHRVREGFYHSPSVRLSDPITLSPD